MLSLERQNALRETYRRANPGWRPATEIYADLVKAQLAVQSGHAQAYARLLDLGCGRGGLVEQLHHPLSQTVGIDPDVGSLRQHRLDLPRAAAFSHQIPFADRSFNVVVASWVLEHVARPSLVFAEISRVLQPDGVFVFITPNGRHPLTTLNREFGRFARLQGMIVEKLYGRNSDDTFPTYYRANTGTTLRQLSQENGLCLTQLHPIPDPTYLAFTPLLFRFMCWFEAHLSVDRHLHLVGVARRHASSQC
jgi:SAM-dependent methyltransferase